MPGVRSQECLGLNPETWIVWSQLPPTKSLGRKHGKARRSLAALNRLAQNFSCFPGGRLVTPVDLLNHICERSANVVWRDLAKAGL